MRSYEIFQRLHNLEWAELCEKPVFAQKDKPTAAMRKGLRFENRVAVDLKEMGLECLHGQWIKYSDAGHEAFLQPDFVLLHHGIILEAKLSLREPAFDKLEQLYVPVAAKVWNREFKVLQICKNIKRTKRPVFLIEKLLEAPNGSVIHHFI